MLMACTSASSVTKVSFQTAHQFLLGHHATPVFDQIGQNLVGPGGQVDLVRPTSETGAALVEHKLPKSVV
jgi:hypothetical protein